MEWVGRLPEEKNFNLSDDFTNGKVIDEYRSGRT
jgi:hypothetical protein